MLGLDPTCVDPEGAVALVVHREVLRVGARDRDPHAVPRRKAVGRGQQHKAHPAAIQCAEPALPSHPDSKQRLRLVQCTTSNMRAIIVPKEDWSLCQQHRVGVRLTSLVHPASAVGGLAERTSETACLQQQAQDDCFMGLTRLCQCPVLMCDDEMHARSQSMPLYVPARSMAAYLVIMTQNPLLMHKDGLIGRSEAIWNSHAVVGQAEAA